MNDKKEFGMRGGFRFGVDCLFDSRNQTTNHFFIDRVNYFYMDRLAKLGIVFYLEDKMNHAKGMIIDTDKGML